MVYGKGMQLQEPGSSPHSLVKLCDLGHSPHWACVFTSEEWGGWTDMNGLLISDSVKVRCRTPVPQGLGSNLGSLPCYYDSHVIMSTFKCCALVFPFHKIELTTPFDCWKD